VLEAFGEGSVEAGSVLGGCRLRPFTSCPNAELAAAKLTGARWPS
jgi:hypothetical protein